MIKTKSFKNIDFNKEKDNEYFFTTNTIQDSLVKELDNAIKKADSKKAKWFSFEEMISVIFKKVNV